MENTEYEYGEPPSERRMCDNCGSVATMPVIREGRRKIIKYEPLSGREEPRGTILEKVERTSEGIKRIWWFRVWYGFAKNVGEE